MSKIPSLEEMLKLYTKKDLWERIQHHIQTIDQLKQQLEESFTEEDVESLIEDRDKTIKFMQKELAEKDCRIEELEGQFAYECECNKQLVDLQKQLAEKDKEIAHLKEKDNYHLLYELAGADETIANLKKQLEEKDKEIKKLTLLYFGDENTETILTANKMIQHIKISFAVEQLEKVKEDVKNVHIEDTQYDCYCFQETTRDKCVEIIDNQINELKEMKQNE